MAFILADRVKETTITTGTSDIVLGGSFGGFNTFSSTVGNSNSTYYAIESPDGSYEIGVGTYTSAGNTLSRDTVLSSSNGGSKITLAGVSTVFVTQPGSKASFITPEGYASGIPASYSGVAFPDGTIQATSATDGFAPVTMRRNDAGAFFHYYVDNTSDRTVALHLEDETNPKWKLGIKDSPVSPTTAPNYGYVFGENGSAGAFADANNGIYINTNNGFWVQHESATVFNVDKTDGSIFRGGVAASPTLIVRGAAAQSANLQEWHNSSQVVLAKVDNVGSISAASFQFPDGTTQTTAATIAAGDNVSVLSNDAGYITVHPTISAPASVNNSDYTFIQDLTLDSNGHIVGITSASGGAFTSWRLSDDASGPYVVHDGRSIKFAGGSNVTTSYDNTYGTLTIASTDTNTTYSAGDGVTLVGTTFSAPDIATASGALRASVTSNSTDITTASGALRQDITTNATDIVTASGALRSSISTNATDISTNTSNISLKTPLTSFYASGQAYTDSRVAISGNLQTQIDAVSAGAENYTVSSGVIVNNNFYTISGVNGLIPTASGALRADITTNTTAIPASGYAISGVLQPQITSNTSSISTNTGNVSTNTSNIALKANIASPTFTGVPAAPTATALTNTTQVATTAFVVAEVAALVDSAPGTLNTLNELAAALGDDAAFSTTVTNSIAAKIGSLVDDTTPQLGGQLDANGQSIDMGTNTITDTKVGYWDTAYGWGDHSSGGYLTSETNDLSASVTWVNVPTANITEASVTQHQAALTITESQISDLQSYLTSETSHTDVVVDGDFASDGILKRTSAGVYGIVTDSSSNWNTAYGWGDHSSGGYQSSDVGLTSIAGLTTAADKMIYTTASDTYAVAAITAAGRAILDDADASAQRTTLGLGALSTLGSVAAGQIDANAVDSSELADGSIDESHLNATNTAVDNYLLSYDSASAGFTWIAAVGGGSMSTFIITDGTTPQTIDNGETITFADGVGAEFVTSATNTVTVNSVDSEIVHDNLSGFVANEHIDWTGASAGTIHATNYTDTNTQLTEDQVDDYVAGLLTAGSNVSLTYDDTAGTLTIDSSYTDTNTTYTGGTNLTLAGTTFNVDDAFLKNDASDVTTGTITAAGFTTAGTLTVDSIGISTIQSSAESFVDNDTSLMTSAAIADKIEAYGYGTSAGDMTGVDLTAGAGITIDSETNTTSGDYSATITCTVTDTNTQLSQEQVEDFVNGVLTAGSNVSLTYDDVAGTLTVASTDTDTVYTLPEATATAKGGIELFSDTDQSVAATAVSTTAARTYGLQLNSDGQGVINVPWTDTDTNTTYSAATSSALGLMKLEDDTEQSVAANAVTATASRTYGIQFNSSDQAVVNVPWVDTNTTYTVGDGGLTQINFTSADNTKLDGIEASATADQTDAEIRAAVEAATDSNVFTDADHTKLNAIEASADVTDTANVVSALTAGTNVTISAGGTIASTDTTTNTMGSGFTVSATTDTTATTITESDDLFFAAGTGITCETTADGTVTITNTVSNTNTQLSEEEVEDFVGGMLGGTETGITVTYQDGTGDIDFVVSDTTVAGDSGSTGITPGDTLTIAGGTNVTTAMSGDTLTVTATDTNTMGSGFTVSATTDTNATTITQGDDLMFTAGTGITCETTADGTVTISCTVTDTNTQLTLIDSDTMTGASSSNVASAESVKAYVDTEITDLIGGAPGALDTLNELAAAINDDASYASTITTALGLKATLASPTFTGTVAIPNVANLETAVVANTAKVTNVSTNLATTTSTTTAIITSSDGTDATIPVATTSVGGVMSKAIFDQHTANVAKNTNVSTALSTGTVDATSYGITSDGGADDIVLAQATTSVAGLLSAAKWDEIVANTAKVTNVSTNLGITTSETTAIITSSDGDNATIPVATTSVGGVMSKALFDKLDGIEASATADQSNAEIRAAVEAATDSNVFTDADHSKLNAIEASADVTDATNVTAAGALMNSEVTNLAAVKAFATSDYATAAQGSTADAALPKAGGAMTGAITTNSTFDGVDIATRDAVLTSTTTTANAALPKAGGAMVGAITTNSTFDGRDVATDGTKLDGIEDSADVTDTANVTSAGALMDSELASIADVKALDQSVISGSSPNFTTANMSDASNKRFMTDAQESKLDGIEASATADQTKADIEGLAITTVGALNSGSITSGFGNINNGSSTITTTGLISGGSLDIDDVVIDGSTIGHTDDTGLITLADGVVTVAGNVVQQPDMTNTALTSQSGSVVINANLGNYFTVATTGAITGLDIQNAVVGQKIVIRFAWGGTHSIAYTDTVIWPGGTAATVTASGVDTLGFICTTASSAFDAFIIGLDIKAA